MLNKFRLTSVTMTNFKCHHNATFAISHLNDFYGKNRVGKSSIVDAINFCLCGTAKDIDKISVGKDYCIVSTEYLHPHKNQKLIFTSRLTKKGTHTFKAEIDGRQVQTPKKFIKEMIGVGTFNPRELILNSKNRDNEILKIMDASIDQSELSRFPLVYEFDVTGLNAFQVFEGIDKDLRGQRLNLYQKKDLLNKAHDKNRKQLDDELTAFQIKHNLVVDKNKDYQSELKEIEKSLINKKASDQMRKEKVEHLELELDVVQENLNFKNKKNKELDTTITHLQKEQTLVCSEIREGERNLKKLKSEWEKAQKENLTNPEIILRLENKIDHINQKITLQKRLKEIALQKKDADLATEEWRKMDDIIKKEIEHFKNEKLKPLLSKVPGLAYQDGKLRLDGKSIDELSGSEVVELGVNLLSLKSAGTLICINEAECLDDDTIEKIEWDDKKDYILIRVAERATKNEDFKSVKIEGGQNEG